MEKVEQPPRTRPTVKWRWSKHASPTIDIIGHDLEALLSKFEATQSGRFADFKACWSASQFSLLHHSKPICFDAGAFLQVAYDAALRLLSDSRPPPPREAGGRGEQRFLRRSLNFQIGALYALECLYLTQLEKERPQPIQVGPRGLLELTILQERLKRAGHACREARATLARLVCSGRVVPVITFRDTAMTEKRRLSTVDACVERSAKLTLPQLAHKAERAVEALQETALECAGLAAAAGLAGETGDGDAAGIDPGFGAALRRALAGSSSGGAAANAAADTAAGVSAAAEEPPPSGLLHAPGNLQPLPPPLPFFLAWPPPSWSEVPYALPEEAAPAPAPPAPALRRARAEVMAVAQQASIISGMAFLHGAADKDSNEARIGQVKSSANLGCTAAEFAPGERGYTDTIRHIQKQQRQGQASAASSNRATAAGPYQLSNGSVSDNWRWWGPQPASRDSGSSSLEGNILRRRGKASGRAGGSDGDGDGGGGTGGADGVAGQPSYSGRPENPEEDSGSEKEDGGDEDDLDLETQLNEFEARGEEGSHEGVEERGGGGSGGDGERGGRGIGLGKGILRKMASAGEDVWSEEALKEHREAWAWKERTKGIPPFKPRKERPPRARQCGACHGWYKQLTKHRQKHDAVRNEWREVGCPLPPPPPPEPEATGGDADEDDSGGAGGGAIAPKKRRQTQQKRHMADVDPTAQKRQRGPAAKAAAAGATKGKRKVILDVSAANSDDEQQWLEEKNGMAQQPRPLLPAGPGKSGGGAAARPRARDAQAAFFRPRPSKMAGAAAADRGAATAAARPAKKKQPAAPRMAMPSFGAVSPSSDENGGEAEGDTTGNGDSNGLNGRGAGGGKAKKRSREGTFGSPYQSGDDGGGVRATAGGAGKSSKARRAGRGPLSRKRACGTTSGISAATAALPTFAGCDDNGDALLAEMEAMLDISLGPIRGGAGRAAARKSAAPRRRGKAAAAKRSAPAKHRVCCLVAEAGSSDKEDSAVSSAAAAAEEEDGGSEDGEAFAADRSGREREEDEEDEEERLAVFERGLAELDAAAAKRRDKACGAAATAMRR
ncbi:unnamed protein product [Phaeothamnion confervicola]